MCRYRNNGLQSLFEDTVALFFSQIIYCNISEYIGLYSESLAVFKCQVCLRGLPALLIFGIFYCSCMCVFCVAANVGVLSDFLKNCFLLRAIIKIQEKSCGKMSESFRLLVLCD